MGEVSVREARERISQLLERVQAGEEVLILRRGRPAARLVAPPSGEVAFRSRASLRDELPDMRESAAEAIRRMREAERF